MNTAAADWLGAESTPAVLERDLIPLQDAARAASEHVRAADSRFRSTEKAAA